VNYHNHTVWCRAYCRNLENVLEHLPGREDGKYETLACAHIEDDVLIFATEFDHPGYARDIIESLLDDERTVSAVIESYDVSNGIFSTWAMIGDEEPVKLEGRCRCVELLDATDLEGNPLPENFKRLDEKAELDAAFAEYEGRLDEVLEKFFSEYTTQELRERASRVGRSLGEFKCGYVLYSQRREDGSFNEYIPLLDGEPQFLNLDEVKRQLELLEVAA